MAVMIRTLSQLEPIEQHGSLDATKDWHEIARYATDPNTEERFWSSWRTALSAEILYGIYAGSFEDNAHGVSAFSDLNESTVGQQFSGGTFPGVLKVLELRNKLARMTDLSVMHDQLSSIVGNDTERAQNNGTGTLNISGDVTAVKFNTLKICSDPLSANLSSTDFNGNRANVVPNARSVYNFTREGLPIFLSPYSDFETLYKSESGTRTPYSGRPNAIRKETVPHDAYIFKIENSGTRSNTWVTPSSGWFTCFGWLSEISTGQASNYQRWVAIEGNLNGSDVTDNEEDEEQNWCILQLQPFYPNPYIGYVGFGIPVSKGLRLRIRTGFAVGSSSGNYAMSNTETRASMANHIANAFVGGIYSKL